MDKDVFEKLSELELLTLCLYGEARGEGLDGMLAVGSVVLNRTKSPSWWGHDVKSVILKPYQFSCFNKADSNRNTLEGIAVDFNDALRRLNILRHAYWVAKGLMEGYLTSNVGPATHYHTTNINPEWRNKLQFIRQIGNHRFYVEPNS